MLSSRQPPTFLMRNYYLKKMMERLLDRVLVAILRSVRHRFSDLTSRLSLTKLRVLTFDEAPVSKRSTAFIHSHV